jgi:hypothetical protein
MPLGATDRQIRMIERFAGCFTDYRAAVLVVHEVAGRLARISHSGVEFGATGAGAAASAREEGHGCGAGPASTFASPAGQMSAGLALPGGGHIGGAVWFVSRPRGRTVRRGRRGIRPDRERPRAWRV